jgi:hypothetical protein
MTTYPLKTYERLGSEYHDTRDAYVSVIYILSTIIVISGLYLWLRGKFKK